MNWLTTNTLDISAPSLDGCMGSLDDGVSVMMRSYIHAKRVLKNEK